MLGRNEKRPYIQGDGTILDIKEIFPTFQGEGPNVGAPSVFIRLGGCNLACTFCDTDFENYNNMKLEDILREVENCTKEFLNNKRPLIVITGGEPLRQPIELLCDKLIESAYKVQIETNGTFYRDLNKKVEIICSPKNVGAGYKTLRSDLLKRLTALKFVVSSTDKLYSDIEDIGQEEYNIPVYIQPMDEQDEIKNKNNLHLAVKLAKKYNANISLQLHKIIGIR